MGTCGEGLRGSLIVGLLVNNNSHLVGNNNGRGLSGPIAGEGTTVTDLEHTTTSVGIIVEKGTLSPVLKLHTSDLIGPIASEGQTASNVHPVTSIVITLVESEEMEGSNVN